MSAERLPGRDDAVRRLCDAEPGLCGEGPRGGGRELPTGWLLLGLLLALIVLRM